MLRFLFIYLTLFFILIFTAVIGEFVSKRLPKSNFNKWWRKNIVANCEECE